MDEEPRNRGTEEPRNRGTEEPRNRGTEESRNRGTEESNIEAPEKTHGLAQQPAPNIGDAKACPEHRGRNDSLCVFYLKPTCYIFRTRVTACPEHRGCHGVTACPEVSGLLRTFFSALRNRGTEEPRNRIFDKKLVINKKNFKPSTLNPQLSTLNFKLLQGQGPRNSKI